MNYVRHLTHHCFILLLIFHVNGSFTPDIDDYDAYGVKIAINQHFLVLAQNNHQPPAFFIHFAPYNHTQPSSQCSHAYPNITNIFIYAVALGKKQNHTQTHFFFLGEQTYDHSTPFIGMLTFNDNVTLSNTTSSSSCNSSVSYSLHHLHNYHHQEYYILGVHPHGVLAYGFSNHFVVMFSSQNTSNVKVWDGNVTWPDTSFTPHAVDISENFGVIAGFVYNGANATMKYSPMIYLINFDASNEDHPVVVDRYQPIPTPSTWQDLLTNSDANMYVDKYDMSVSIDERGKVLVGMQFINRVFLLSVDMANATYFTYVSRHTNGRSLGNGKSVAWMENGIAAILINVYTLSYQWLSSQIFFFDIYADEYNSTTTPLSVFPNSHQRLPSRMSSIFVNVVSSPSSLALLDDKGKVLLFNPTEAGFYPYVEDTGLMPIITVPTACMPGTYRNRTGVHDCVLCPTGTKNPGNANIQCDACSSDSFCPLGSVADVSKSTLKTISQIVPYPLSPESTIFDEILLHNMFTIGSGRCVFTSPLFWTLIVASTVILIIIIMEILKLCVKNPRTERLRNVLKRVFRHTDLIGEGEYWVGGLVSFSVIVLVSFSYGFSNAYLKQYPIEKTSPSYFACDTTMRNAKFKTNIQSLAISPTHAEQEMFDLLDRQHFLLHIDFINTLVNCDSASVQVLFGTKWLSIHWSACDNSESILSLSIPLPSQHTSIQISLENVKTIGALCIGLSGPGEEQENYSLKHLHFYRTFSKKGYMLSHTLAVSLEMTKVINETHPMTGEEFEFEAIYVPTFTVDKNSLFESNDQYVRSLSTLTTLTLEIKETPYYVKKCPTTHSSTIRNYIS